MRSDARPQDKQRARAIETEYGGYRFRSRLEARWAVFFDEMGIKYEYEPEGFELSDGTKYLPDFYLPDFQLYVEIKPVDRDVVSSVGDGNKWERKCAAFRHDVGKAILLCYGEPAEDVFKLLFCWDTTYSGGGEGDFFAMFKCIGNKPYLVAYDTRTDRDIFTSSTFDSSDSVITAWQWVHRDENRLRIVISEIAEREVLERFNPDATDQLNVAKKRARQARFEHGERPDEPPRPRVGNSARRPSDKPTWVQWLHSQLPNNPNGNDRALIERQRALLEHEIEAGNYDRSGPFIEHVIAHFEEKASYRTRLRAIIEFLLLEIGTDKPENESVESWEASGAMDRFESAYPDGVEEIGIKWDDPKGLFKLEDFMVAAWLMKRYIAGMDPSDYKLLRYRRD